MDKNNYSLALRLAADRSVKLMCSKGSLLRIYVRSAGTLLAVLSLADLFRLWEARPDSTVLYLFSAVIFTYLGFSLLGQEQIRYVVGGFGVLYLLSAVLLIGMFIFDHSADAVLDLKQGIIRLALSIASILAAHTFRGSAPTSVSSERQPACW